MSCTKLFYKTEGDKVFIEIPDPGKQFLQYWYFYQESEVVRDLALDDYLEDTFIVTDPDVQIFDDIKFEIWMEYIVTPPQPEYYLVTEGLEPLYTGGDKAHLLLPESNNV